MATSTPSEKPVDMLMSSVLFAPLSVADREAVVARMRPARFAPGQLIFSRGDAGREVYLVIEGRVRLSVLSGEGRELTLAHATPGTVFGQIAALDGGERTADATAIDAVKTQVLTQAQLIALIESNPRVARAAISFLCGLLRETDLRLESIALHSIEVRLARQLLTMPSVAAAGNKPAHVVIDLGMSQSELGLLIGASRPKVNIALATLEKAGAISRDGNKLVCSTVRLQDIANQE
jgi:CRP/FNR family transcriptional regulator, cyclic AMP receptor protein